MFNKKLGELSQNLTSKFKWLNLTQKCPIGIKFGNLFIKKFMKKDYDESISDYHNRVFCEERYNKDDIKKEFSQLKRYAGIPERGSAFALQNIKKQNESISEEMIKDLVNQMTEMVSKMDKLSEYDKRVRAVIDADIMSSSKITDELKFNYKWRNYYLDAADTARDNGSTINDILSLHNTFVNFLKKEFELTDEHLSQIEKLAIFKSYDVIDNYNEFMNEIERVKNNLESS
jgi:hypothetical protein